MSGYHHMESISFHQLNTTSKSVAMDMTLVDGTISEPFLTAGNDQVRNREIINSFSHECMHSCQAMN